MSTVVLLRQSCLGCRIRGWNGDLRNCLKIAGEFVKELKKDLQYLVLGEYRATDTFIYAWWECKML